MVSGLEALAEETQEMQIAGVLDGYTNQQPNCTRISFLQSSRWILEKIRKQSEIRVKIDEGPARCRLASSA